MFKLPTTVSNKTFNRRTTMSFMGRDVTNHTRVLTEPVPLRSEVEECETLLAYNDYLQALYLNAIAKQQIAEKKNKMEKDLSAAQKLLKKKQDSLREINDQIETLKKQNELVELLNNLENEIEKSKSLLSNDNRNILNKLKECLEKECENVKSNNVNLPKTQAEVDKLCDIIQKLQFTLEGILNFKSNRQDVCSFANDIRTYLKLKEGLNKLAESSAKTVNERSTNLIEKISDFFAGKYENPEGQEEFKTGF